MMLYQRRLFLELMGNTAVTALLLMAVLMLVASVEVVSRMEGVGIGDFVASVPVFAATTLDILLPLSVLVSVVLTYGRVASDNEYDTWRASGVAAWHLLTPGAVFGLLMCALMLLGMDYALPYAGQAQRRMQGDVDMAQVVKKKLASGEAIDLDERKVLSIQGYDDEGFARGVRIQDLDEVDGQLTVVQELLAERAEIVVDEQNAELVMHLYDVRRPIGGRLAGEMTVRQHLGYDAVHVPFKAMTTPQLMAWTQRDLRQRQRFGWIGVELQIAGRAAASAACLLFVLLGLPVALAVRRADRVGAFGVAFLLALFVYYPLVQIGRSLAERQVLTPTHGAWVGNVVLLLLSAGLWVRLFRR